MQTVSAYKLDVGRKRQKNEDYIWIDEDSNLYIAADGMGGHEAGEIASELAANTVGQFVLTRLARDSTPKRAEAQKLLTEAIEQANITVSDASKQAAQKKRMGATIVVALLRASTAYISHAGDARAYLVRGSTIMQLTEDDSWGAQFSTGETEDKDIKRRYEHILTKAVGQDSKLEPSFSQVSVVPGDWLLLCSDGLWNMVTDEDILSMLNNTSDPQAAVDALTNAANEAGGNDNIAIVVVKVLDEDAAPPNDNDTKPSIERKPL